MVSFTRNHFWSGIARTTACGFEHFAILVHVREAEVDDLNIVLVIEQQVLWFQVSVADANLVNILDTRNNLLCKSACLLFL